MMHFEVRDSHDWTRRFKVNKPIAYIGSGEMNDVVLDSTRLGNNANGASGSVQPRHVQLIDTGHFSLEQRPLYQLVNLADQHVLVKTAEDDVRTVVGLTAIQVMAGELICLGGFEVLLLGDATQVNPSDVMATAIPNTARNPIGLEVVAPTDTVLRASATLPYQVRIRNDGTQNAVQFVIEVEGLPREAYELRGAAPQLFPGRSDTMELLLKHPCSSVLPVGRREFVVRVTAPRSYNAYVATSQHQIEVAPCYRHKLSLKQNGMALPASTPHSAP
jgi:hypothetical protein